MENEAELARRLYRHPCLGLESEIAGSRAMIRAYFSEKFSIADLRMELQKQIRDFQWHGATAIRLPDTSDRPGEVREVFLAGRKLLLDCGPAFGTGAHETTRLAAELLQGIPLAGHSLLDLGAGSGILAILAKQLGASAVQAVEILPEARENAAENFRRNGVGEIPIYSSLKETVGPFDIVVANLLAPILLQLRETMLQRFAPGGILILSGILECEREKILEAFTPGRLKAELRREGWLGLRLSYPK